MITTAANPPGVVLYVRGPWVRAYLLLSVLEETDAMYGRMLRNLKDDSSDRKETV